jgi:hypothetical protein
MGVQTIADDVESRGEVGFVGFAHCWFDEVFVLFRRAFEGDIETCLGLSHWTVYSYIDRLIEN